MNKVETKVQLFFKPEEASWLSPVVLAKFLELHEKKLTAKREFIVMASVSSAGDSYLVV